MLHVPEGVCTSQCISKSPTPKMTRCSVKERSLSVSAASSDLLKIK